MNKTELKYLASSCLNENEYKIFENLLNQNKLLLLRNFISEKLELSEIVMNTVDSDEILLNQIQMLNRMEDLIINELETA